MQMKMNLNEMSLNEALVLAELLRLVAEGKADKQKIKLCILQLGLRPEFIKTICNIIEI